MSKRRAIAKTAPVVSYNWLDDVLPVEIVEEIAGYLLPLDVLVFSLTSKRHETQMKPFKKRPIRLACFRRCQSCALSLPDHFCVTGVCPKPAPGTVIKLTPSKFVAICSFRLSSFVYRDGAVCFLISESVVPSWAIRCRYASRAFRFMATKPKAVFFGNPLKYKLQRATVFEKVLICWADQAEDTLQHLLLSS